MLQKFSIHEEHAVNSHVFSLHKSHSELKEWFGQVDQIVNLPPFNIGNLELGVFMITAIFVDDISQSMRTAKHQEGGISACLNIMQRKQTGSA